MHVEHSPIRPRTAQERTSVPQQGAARNAAQPGWRAPQSALPVRAPYSNMDYAAAQDYACRMKPDAQQAMRVPDERQRRLTIRICDGSELYHGLGSSFLGWGRTFMRQLQYAQAICGFDWSEDVRTDLLGQYISDTDKHYYNKKAQTWWYQTPTLAHVMERLHQTFKTSITASQSMKLFKTKKDPNRGCPEHYLYLVAVSDACGGADAQVLEKIVHYASTELRTVQMAKYDGSRPDYLAQAEELAHFAQSVELDTRSTTSFGKDVVTHVAESKPRVDTRTCFGCGKVGHIQSVCPDKRKKTKRSNGVKSTWRNNTRTKDIVTYTLSIQEAKAQDSL
ncbi:unnamed protein product [Albugo candida]|uniref:CCHC-type domain-containing protein n=1 Tax=Albugo candida TaxID=65357 RepID=A0A024FWA1_9STRA|nr:unnamed protein product [Albugo candida]|eukprot:CCI11395.1 unnamed protein product [Albugo candida]